MIDACTTAELLNSSKCEWMVASTSKRKGELADGHWDDTAKNERIRTETFSLADGLGNEGSGWDIMEHFDLIEEPSLALAAPEPSLTDQLGILPAEVATPEQTLPALGDGEINTSTDKGTAGAEAEDAELSAPAHAPSSADLTP